MAFCSKCGQPISDDANFCQYCGAPVNKGSSHSYKKREQEYAGNMITCPSCGDEIPSFTAICPSCGHEINSASLAPALRDFIDKINMYDKIIAATPKGEFSKKGWKSWSTGIRILWVIVNIYMFCIPLVVYFTWPLLKPFFGSKTSPELMPPEQQKAALIENFTFPNDRKSVLEALFFVKSKIAFLSSEKISDRSIYWLRLWNTKAIQLHQIADILLPNDSLAKTAYSDITANKRKVDHMIRLRASIGAISITAFCIIFIFNGRLLNGQHIIDYLRNSEGSPTITATTVTDNSRGIYTYAVRNYIGKNAATIGEVDGDYLVDSYGSGKLKIIFVTADGMVISSEDDIKKKYIVVAQNIKEGTNITIVHLRNSSGKPYNNLVDYQSYDEIVLFVAPIGDTTYVPTYTTIEPTFDRHIYHIRDYVGRNAATFGTIDGDDRIDEYGEGKLKLSFTSEDGSYVNSKSINDLKGYIVIAQDIAPNTELKLEYDTDSYGNKYDNLIRSQNYEEINLTVRRLDDSIVSEMPELSTSNSDDSLELTVKYKILDNGTAEITGFSGDGNHVTIDRKIGGHEVVSIGDSAFKDCTTLESVLFWADIETIGDYAFSGCTALKEISIPFETTLIGSHAFEGCTALEDLTIWGSPSISEYAFAGCTSITDVSISMGTKIVAAHAFDGCINLTSATIWDDDTIIEKDAFANCPKLIGAAIQE